jgi:hypothetical protein
MNAQLTVRYAAPGDDVAVQRLAALDSALPPKGRVLLAEVDGSTVAALSVENEAAVADPFTPTAHVVEMLRLHATQFQRAA